MKFIRKTIDFVLIGIATPYTLFDWQWWAWTIALILAVALHTETMIDEVTK